MSDSRTQSNSSPITEQDIGLWQSSCSKTVFGEIKIAQPVYHARAGARVEAICIACSQTCILPDAIDREAALRDPSLIRDAFVCRCAQLGVCLFVERYGLDAAPMGSKLDALRRASASGAALQQASAVRAEAERRRTRAEAEGERAKELVEDSSEISLED